jgi:peptidoglycan/LPS O-acetylase OafA/YrhL
MKRDLTIDFMRLTALVVIVLLHHLPSYLFNFYDLRRIGMEVDLSELQHLTRYYGLGLFTFLSGHLMATRGGEIRDLSDVRGFLIRRFRRLFPLYWIALALYYFLFFISPSRELGGINLALHGVGLQLLYGEPVFTLWYVGLLTVYYVIFASVRYLAPPGRILSMSVIAFCGLGVLIELFPAIDRRLFLYWPMFALGTLFDRGIPELRRGHFMLSLGTVVAGSYLYVRLLRPPESMESLMSILPVVLVLTVVMIAFTGVARYVCPRSCGPNIAKAVFAASYSSYAVYLFHTPVFQATKLLLNDCPIAAYRLMAFALAIAGLLVSAWRLQSFADQALRKA